MNDAKTANAPGEDRGRQLPVGLKNQELLETIEELEQDLAAAQKLIAQQAKELNTKEEQISHLRQELENSQERIAQLELEEQELQTRLVRQQRHSLKFKAALDQCLAGPSPVPKVEPIQPWSGKLDRADSNNPDNTKPNWPSPTINGLGKEKKSKSRADIDLPKFG